MCGIAGFTGQCRPQLLQVFQRFLHHRGPDEHGTLCLPELGLVHDRLAIIDLAGGRQPIFNEDGNCAIVLNGEIYNYRELRKDLLPRHQFRTHSDTEVVLHLYEEKGSQTSEYLKGDFAFCIWDARQRLCYLSRDPLGVKPLFYTSTADGNLAFSSELTCLLEHPEVDKHLDFQAVAEYLSCLYVPAPRSFVRGIWKLQPGESLIWRDGTLRRWRYWQVPPVMSKPLPAAEFECRIDELLQQAVARRLIADVPVGAFLSGGLDSSLIVALACHETAKLMTFSIGYGEPDFDELEFAKTVSRFLGTDHQEFIIRPEATRLLEEVIAAMDEPIADSSAIPTYLVARETRQFVKVALSGVGGDEMFLGYPRYLGAKLSQGIPRFAAPAVKAITGLFSSQPAGRDVGGWIRRFGEGLGMDPWERYRHWTTFLDLQALKSMLPSGPMAGQLFADGFTEACEQPCGGYLDRIFRLDITRYLPSNLLKFGDAMTMAHSLEMRVPFCDVDLVDELARTPASVRLPGLKLKPILRKLASKYLPLEIIRRPKQGFMIPIGRWFRGELRSYLEQQLSHGKLPAFLNSAAVDNLVCEHMSGSRNHTHVLWAILVLNRWLQLHPKVRY